MVELSSGRDTASVVRASLPRRLKGHILLAINNRALHLVSPFRPSTPKVCDFFTGLSQRRDANLSFPAQRTRTHGNNQNSPGLHADISGQRNIYTQPSFMHCFIPLHPSLFMRSIVHADQPVPDNPSSRSRGGAVLRKHVQ